MYDEKPGPFDAARQVSRWDGEGGAIPMLDATFNADEQPDRSRAMFHQRGAIMDHDISGLMPLGSAGAPVIETKMGSSRIKSLADKGLGHPRTLTQAEIRELCASVLKHLASGASCPSEAASSESLGTNATGD